MIKYFSSAFIKADFKIAFEPDFFYIIGNDHDIFFTFLMKKNIHHVQKMTSCWRAEKYKLSVTTNII